MAMFNTLPTVGWSGVLSAAAGGVDIARKSFSHILVESGVFYHKMAKLSEHICSITRLNQISRYRPFFFGSEIVSV